MLLYTQPVVKKHIVRLLFVLVLFSVIYLLVINVDEKSIRGDMNSNIIDFNKVYGTPHSEIVKKFYDKRKSWRTSNLGSILFKNADPPTEDGQYNKTFVILVWKHWEWLKNRHVFNFGTASGDPLEGCRVRNCEFVGEDRFLETADAVVVHLHKGLIPKVEKRNPLQRWVFLSDEAPGNTFAMAKKPPKLSELGGIFNWSMTYRSDSDIPVPYGRTVPRTNPVWADANRGHIAALVPNWKKKRRDVLAAVLMSNCGVRRRMEFLQDLNAHLTVDVHGKCSTNHKDSCPGHFRSDCKVMAQYLFYLVLENSMCDQYLTEKIFHHAYSRGAIPIIQGPLVEDCEKLLPPNSYLHVENFQTIEELANNMTEIAKHDEKLLEYHRWRNDFQVLNEHGYFGSKSYHLCRLCEAMNYNNPDPSVYSQSALKLFLDEKLLCNME